MDACQHVKGFSLHPDRRIFNLLGGGLALTSVAMPWYMVWFCGVLASSWLFQLHDNAYSWLILSLVVGGGILSLFSRYGGPVTLLGSLAFALTFSTDQVFYTITGVSPAGPLGKECLGSSFYGPSQLPALHLVGLWFAISGGVVSLMGKTWNPNTLWYSLRRRGQVIDHREAQLDEPESP